MATLDEMLGALADYVGDDKAKVREVALALNATDTTKPIAEVLLKRGMSKRTADAETRIADLEGQLARMKDELDEKDQEIEKSRSDAPDWKKRLEDQERRYQEKLATATKALEDERRARDEGDLAGYRARFVKELGPGIHVDEDWAETVLAAKYADRFRLGEGRKLEVLEPDETTPYGSDVEDPIKQLAQDVLRTVPAKYRIMGRADAGGGVSSGATGDFKPRTDEQVREAQRRQVGYATP